MINAAYEVGRPEILLLREAQLILKKHRGNIAEMACLRLTGTCTRDHGKPVSETILLPMLVRVSDECWDPKVCLTVVSHRGWERSWLV